MTIRRGSSRQPSPRSAAADSGAGQVAAYLDTGGDRQAVGDEVVKHLQEVADRGLAIDDDDGDRQVVAEVS
jgi:hypothetical protein